MSELETREKFSIGDCSVRTLFKNIFHGLYYYLVVFIAVVFSTVAGAVEFKEDFSHLKIELRHLESKMRDVEENNKQQEARLRILEQNWRICSNQSFRVIWEPRRKTIEIYRSKLETDRDKTEEKREVIENQIRPEIERIRREIENEFSGKARGRNYEQELKDRYIDNLRNQYIKGIYSIISEYKGYSSEMKVYMDVVGVAIESCSSFKGTITEVLLTLVSKLLGEKQ